MEHGLLPDYVEDLEIPEIAEAQRLNMNPGDTLIVMLENIATHRELERVQATLEAMLPEQKVVVFNMPVRLAVLGPEGV
jgi:hypothetical protein